MKNKINVAELLRNCPNGLELDCTMFDNAYFERVNENVDYPIRIKVGKTDVINLTKYGCWNKYSNAKCVIFPKGKTTWEGFVPPIKFKDGDILYLKAISDWVCIYKEDKDTKNFYIYVAIEVSSADNIVYNNHLLCCKKDIIKIRIATKEEKQKFFHAIKANGYKWNVETKTLEKLPMFKVGDRIKPIGSAIGSDRHYIIKNIKIDRYILNDGKFLKFTDEHNFELVPNKFDITTLKPFDEVLVRTDNKHIWSIQFFERINKILKDSFVCMGGVRFRQCIPYKGNEHLLNTVNDCDDFYKTWK